MASMQQGGIYETGFSYNTYRTRMSNGVRIGACVVGANIVPCLCCFGFIQLLAGIIWISTSTGGPFGTDTTGIIIGSIILVIGVLLLAGGITLACIAYHSFNNTQVANPGQTINPPGGAYLQGSSMPYSSAGPSAYSSVNTQGAGFSSQYNYSPSPGFSAQPGGATHPPPPPGFLGQPGGSSYQPPPTGFSGQPEGTPYLPTPGYSEKPGIDPPPYDSSIPSAPTM